MHRLRTSIYENSFTITAQVEHGANPKHRATILGHQLAEKSRVIENQYKLGIISPAELLQEAAADYDDQRLDNYLRIATDQDSENEPTGTETTSSSK